MTDTLYIIEVRKVEDPISEWVPMYAPCYSIWDADKKRDLKAKIFGADRLRIGIWKREQTR